MAGRVGKFAAYDEYIEFEYAAGQIFFKGNPCLDAIDNGYLVLTFEKTKKDNPFVHGIVLVNGVLDDTEYYEQDSIRKNWDKIMKEEQRKKEEEKIRKQEARMKKKEKVKIRNDHLSDMDNQFEHVEKTHTTSHRLSLRNLLMGPLGVAALWAAFFASLLFLRKLFHLVDTPPKAKNH